MATSEIHAVGSISGPADGVLPQLSWVLPAYRTADLLHELLDRIHRTSAAHVDSFEIVLVDDACPEGTGTLATALAEGDPHLRVLQLPRNRGQDAALVAGLRQSRGHWAVILDADLQDPPEALAQLWPLRLDGFDVVFARRTGSYTTRGRHLTSFLYRAAVAQIGGLPRGACLFALLQRATAQRVAVADNGRSLLARIVATGARCTSVAIERSPRPSGRSSYSSLARGAKAARSLWQIAAARGGRLAGIGRPTESR